MKLERAGEIEIKREEDASEQKKKPLIYII